MHRQPPAVYIIRLLTQQIEHLAVDHTDQEIEGRIRIRHDKKQCRLPVAQCIQLQLVIGRYLPKLLDIEGRKAGTGRDIDRFRRFARSKRIFFILPHSKVIRILLLQLLKHQIHRIFELLIVLPDLHRIQHFQKSRKVLLLLRCLVMDVADQCRIEQRLRFDPEIVIAFSVSLGVRNQRCHQLQNVLFAVNVSEGIIMLRLFKIDRIQNPDAVALP